MMSRIFLKVSKMEILDWENELASALPKIELHLHLDGSLSSEYISRRAKARRIELPVSANQLRQWMHERKSENLAKNDDNKIPTDPASALTGNWPVFDFCNQFLQTEGELIEATEDLLERMSSNNVIYAEIRFCPTLHTREGLSNDDVIKALSKGFQNQSSKTGIKGGFIVCALRSLSSEHGVEMAKLAAKYLQRNPSDPIGVVGFDVAGDEGSFPFNSKTDPMFLGVKEAQKLGVPLTCHAGEWPEKYATVENVRFAVHELGVRRIGHGVALRSDLKLLDEVKAKGNITLEVCLTSNVGQKFKVSSYDVHPAKIFFEKQVPFSLNCDNTLLSGNGQLDPTPNHEVLKLAKEVITPTEADPYRGWRAVQFSLKSGANAAFSPTIDQAWIQDFNSKVDGLLEKFLPKF